MSRADLVGDPAMTGQGPQRNGWFGDIGLIGPYQLIVNRERAKEVECFPYYATCSKPYRLGLFRRLRLWILGR